MARWDEAADGTSSSSPTVMLTFAKSAPHLPFIVWAEGRYESASGWSLTWAHSLKMSSVAWRQAPQAGVDEEPIVLP